MSGIIVAPPKDTSLLGVALLEKDTNGDVFTTWNHPPFVWPELEALVKAKSGIAKYTPNQGTTSVFTKYKDKWIYITTQAAQGKHLVSVSICLFTTTFNPEKYFQLCNLMAETFLRSKSATQILDVFLAVLTTAKYEGFNSEEWDAKKDHFLSSPLLDVVKLFEESSWMIWSAILMKKRVAVYADNQDQLQKIVRALPLFVLHRQDWSLLRPIVDLSNHHEMEDLAKAGVYIAGFSDSIIHQREELFDILLDVVAQTVTIAEHAQDDFVQTDFHKTFSSFFLQGVEATRTEGLTDQKFVIAVKKKTGDLLGRLQGLKQDGYISFSKLHEQKLPPNMDKFLYSVASAEGMTNIHA